MEAVGDIETRRRVAEAIEKIAGVIRAQAWRDERGLTPTQCSMLRLLAANRPEGLRVSAIGAALGIRQPTATKCVDVLERRGLVSRRADPEDARAVRIHAANDVAAPGQPMPPGIALVLGATRDLDPGEASALLGDLVTMIRALEAAGMLTPQRMCLSCRHFRPGAHPGEARPHHCALADMALGLGDLRLDCREQERLDDAAAAVVWQRFRGSRQPRAAL